MRPLLLVLVVLSGACSVGEAVETTTTPTPSVSVVTTSSTAPSTTVATTTTKSTAPSTMRPPGEPEPAALVTPTGVVVAMMQEASEGYLVRTPCGAETVVSTGTLVSGISVVIDPGHGGEVDTGAVGANGLMEKHLNLELSRAVEAKLIVRGISVLLTRTGDYSTILGVRTRLADHLGADLILSVHHNAPNGVPSDRPGTEVFIQSDSPESRRLGGLVWEGVFDTLSEFDIDWTTAPDAGVLRVLSTRGNDAYGMIRGAHTVSVLAELGYLSNPPEAELFATNEYIEAASEAVADAVEAFLNSDDTGRGFVAAPRVFNPQPGIGGSNCVDPALE